MLSFRHRILNHASKCSNLYFYNAAKFSRSVQHSNAEPLEKADKNIEISLYKDVVAKIGLEVHAQLNIQSKLFSQGGNSSLAPPNSQLDFLDISLPGSLPKLNLNAIKAALLTSLGLNCTVQDYIHFDRKNYFYTDMPAGYQITQYHQPIAKSGYVDFIVTTYHRSVIAHSQQYDIVKYLYSEDRRFVEDMEPYLKRSHIKQIQLEQDSAKTLVQNSIDSKSELCNLVDYNRSGAALIEIVFEPDLTNHHEASSLVKELILILQTLNTCDCELQTGSLRVDANISIDSISKQPIQNSKRVELKNLNSLRSLNRGIYHEIRRQVDIIKSGKEVAQESRSFDTKTCMTLALRDKEDTVDYRYVPEPSIPPLKISESMLESARRELPSELPHNLRARLLEYKIELALVAELLEEPGLCGYFLELMRNRPEYDANVIADFLIYAVANLKTIEALPIQIEFIPGSDFITRLSVEKVKAVFDMMLQEEISYSIAYEVVKHVLVNDGQSDPRKIVNDFGWYQINDPAKVSQLCNELIANMKNIPKKYKKKGDKKYLRLMLLKLCELTDNKISVKRAVKFINERLRPDTK